MKNGLKKGIFARRAAALAIAASFMLIGCGSSTTGSSGRGGAGSSLTETTEITEAVEVSEAVTEIASETETGVYEIPDDFGEGYVEADYATYSAADKEKGDKIWLVGTAVETATVEDGDAYDFCVSLKDADENQWLLILDKTDSESEDQKHDDDYNTNGMAVAGIFMGLTTNNIPVIVANKYFLVADGTVITSKAYGDAVYTGEDTEGGDSSSSSGSSDSSKDSGSKRTGISDDFKKAMDEYEEFFDEYVDFMKDYDVTDTKQLTKYMKFLTQYTETMEAFEAWEDEDMTDEEAAYYAEVSLRIEKKLLEAVQ